MAPAALLTALVLALGPDLARTGADVLDAQVAVLAPEMAKGLEFDSVIVVEPARLVAKSPQGLRALTRTTRRLRVVSSEPLPPSLAATVGREPAPEARGAGPSSTDERAAAEIEPRRPDNVAVAARQVPAG